MSPDLFTLFQRDGYIRVRREVHEVMHPSGIVAPLQVSGGSVMICLNWSGLSSAMLCGSRMKSADYLNARIHWAQIVKKWFREHEESFSLINWPPQGSYLNPIESFCWKRLAWEWFDSPVFNPSAWWKSIATLDGKWQCILDFWYNYVAVSQLQGLSSVLSSK